MDLCDDIALYNGYEPKELPSPWTILRQMYSIKHDSKPIKEIDISMPGVVYNETTVMSITQQKEYSASDVAKMIGTTPNMIGRIANKLGIKSKTSCNQYGRWVSSKSRYSSKEITQWMYYQTAIDLIRNTFSKKNKNISYQESLFGEEYEKHN